MTFDLEENDYLYNKQLKTKIQNLIVTISMSNVKNGEYLEKALLLLAKSTGCAEDQEIADKIIDDLHEKQFITDENVKFFYDNVSTNRWF